MALVVASTLVWSGLTLAPAAAAVGSVTSASPPAVSNTSRGGGAGCESSDEDRVTFTHTTPFPQAGDRTPTGDPGPGTQVELVRTDTAGSDEEDTIVGDVIEIADDTAPFSTPACFRFGPGSDDEPPANPGRYNVHIYVEDRDAGDVCIGCFSVFSAPPTVSRVTPNQLPNGVQGQIFTVHGANYALSTVVEALFAGTSIVDSSITFTEATRPILNGLRRETIENTATTLSRTIRVDPSSPAGFRDIRVTNTDRQSGVLASGLRISGILISRIDPNASGNDSVRRATLTGRGFVPGSVPSLVDETSATATVIIGSPVTYIAGTSMAADFDLRRARPGSYRVRVQAPDGSASTPECSPVFTVVDTAGGTSGSSTVRSSDFGCRSAGAAPSPSPTASASATPRATASPSGSAAPTAGSSGTPGATASATPAGSTSPGSTSTPAATTSPSATTSPATGARYAGLASPLRVLDTRAEGGQRRSGEIVLDLSSRLPDPGARSAVLNVTLTNATSRGFLVAYPHGTQKPGTSNVNVNPGQTQANEVVVGLSPSKRVALFVDSMSAHVIADLVGALTTSGGDAAGRMTTSAPSRAFDSRTTSTPLRRGEVVLSLADRLPTGATDAILNVTVTRPNARGHLTVFPTGTTRPGTSNVNFERGQTQANEVMTRVGTGSNAGRVSLFVDSADAAVVVDLVGAVSPAGRQYAITLERPTRALDTRDDRGTRRSGEVELTLPAAVPANATGVILNVTATNGTRAGHVTVHPAGTDNPGTSNVNFPGERRATATSPASAGTQANEVITGLGSNRRVTLSVGGAHTPAAHLVVDVVGYLAP